MRRIEEIKARMGEIETRSAEIVTAVATAEGEALTKLKDETASLMEERKALATELATLEERERVAENIEAGAEGTPVKKPEEVRGEEMTVKKIELRDSAEYVNAYANYVKTGKTEEIRALLTKNGGGDVMVPTIVDEVIRTAWETEGLLKYVHAVSVKGNLQIGFEFSAEGATFHTEGTDAPKEEKLELGTVTLTPETAKKWIHISDEVMDMDSGAFLEYVYKELAYRIAKAISDRCVKKVVDAPQTATKTAPAVAKVETSGIMDVINAVAKLSDEATNPVIVMNKQSYAYYKGLAMASNYAVDPFDGLTVVFNNTLDVADGKTAGTYMIVGDFGEGMTLNYPAGTNISFKFDDVSEAEKDLIKIVGRCPVAVEITAQNAFCKVVKTA